MKYLLRLKGGAGSGNFGHKGRPGQVGGSMPKDSSAASTAKINSVSDIPMGETGRGYFITSDEAIVNITGEFGSGSNDHVGFAAATEDPELLGVDKSVAKKYVELSEKLYSAEANDLSEDEYDSLQQETEEAYMKLWDSINSSGNVRVREFDIRASATRPRFHIISIQNLPITNSNLKKIQGWLGEKLPSDKTARYSWDSLGSDVPIDVSWDDLMIADNIRELRNSSTYKEYDMKIYNLRLKGGAGSGFFGHKGRPGEKGGSLPADSQNSHTFSNKNPLSLTGSSASAARALIGSKISWDGSDVLDLSNSIKKYYLDHRDMFKNKTEKDFYLYVENVLLKNSGISLDEGQYDELGQIFDSWVPDMFEE